MILVIKMSAGLRDGTSWRRVLHRQHVMPQAGALVPKAPVPAGSAERWSPGSRHRRRSWSRWITQRGVDGPEFAGCAQVIDFNGLAVRTSLDHDVFQEVVQRHCLRSADPETMEKFVAAENDAPRFMF